MDVQDCQALQEHTQSGSGVYGQARRHEVVVGPSCLRVCDTGIDRVALCSRQW